MVCYAGQHNQLKPTGGISGLRPFCVATPVGFFIGDSSMKTCPKCNKAKPLSAYSKNRTQYDGYCGRCKTCVSAYQKAYQKTDIYLSKQRAYRKTKRGREVHRKALARYYQSEKGRASRRIASQKFRKNHPDRTIANSSVAEAVKAGRIPRPDSLNCCCCYEPAKQYHHYLGYNKKQRLDVKAVCVKCHTKIHWNVA